MNEPLQPYRVGDRVRLFWGESNTDHVIGVITRATDNHYTGNHYFVEVDGCASYTNWYAPIDIMHITVDDLKRELAQ